MTKVCLWKMENKIIYTGCLNTIKDTAPLLNSKFCPYCGGDVRYYPPLPERKDVKN